MISLKEWQNLLDYYIECLERERLQSVSFKQSGLGTKFFSNMTEEETFISTSIQSISLKLSGELESFILKSKFQGKTKKLFYAYPFLAYEGGEIIPLFVHEVFHEIDNDEPLLHLKKINIYPEFNYSILSKEGMVREQIYGIINEIMRLQRERDDSIPEREQFVSLVQFSLLNTRYEKSPLLNPERMDAVDFKMPLETGLYNQALLYWGETDFYIKGLVDELNELKREEHYNQIGRTALVNLFKDKANIETRRFPFIYSVLPLNPSQNEAIQRGLNDDFTVVTGPPGTGKSQVLVNLIVNALIENISVLFASKNNKAVDVVYERLDDLTRESYIIRSGSVQYRKKAFIELAQKASKIKYGYNPNEYEKLKSQANRAIKRIMELTEIKLKRETLQQSISDLNEEIQKSEFSNFWFKAYYNETQSDVTDLLNFHGDYQRIKSGKKRILETILDIFPGKKTEERLLLKIRKKLKGANLVNLNPEHFGELEKIFAALFEYQKYVENNKRIKQHSQMLKNLPEFNEIEIELEKNQNFLYQNSIALYSNKWIYNLAAAPSSKASALQDFIRAQEEIHAEKPSFAKGIRSLKKRALGLMTEVVEVLPIWGVTNLAAKGAFPLCPGMYDLLVIDEASQCDIASAVPLLFRAKKALVIGDDKQLIHVSTLFKKVDEELAEKYDVHEHYLDFSYKNVSLYNLAEKRYMKAAHPIILRGHYRSHKDIIKFSNDHFYGEALEIFTDTSKFMVNDLGMYWINVKGAARRLGAGNIFNRPEADAVFDYFITLLQKYQMEISYGIVTPFREQKNILRDKLARYVRQHREVEKYDIIIDTAHGFQGDEKDIMIFSPVISKGLPEGTVNFVNGNANLLNVAITRARQRLIVIGDFAFARQNEGLVNDLALYVENLGNVRNSIND